MANSLTVLQTRPVGRVTRMREEALEGQVKSHREQSILSSQFSFRARMDLTLPICSQLQFYHLHMLLLTVFSLLGSFPFFLSNAFMTFKIQLNQKFSSTTFFHSPSHLSHNSLMYNRMSIAFIWGLNCAVNSMTDF